MILGLQYPTVLRATDTQIGGEQPGAFSSVAHQLDGLAIQLLFLKGLCSLARVPIV